VWRNLPEIMSTLRAMKDCILDIAAIVSHQLESSVTEIWVYNEIYITMDKRHIGV
jgi:hypothetical protein